LIFTKNLGVVARLTEHGLPAQQQALYISSIVMTTLRLYSFFLLAISFFACKTQEQQRKPDLFTLETKTLKADTVVRSAVYFDGHLFCLQADDKIFVLDTLLRKDSSLTAKFSNIKAAFLQTYYDTVLIGTKNNLYFLGKDLTLKNYKPHPFRYGLPYYNDDTYYVRACSVGEFGGAVFFLNKLTNKTYSYPATAVQQVFKFDNTYVVSNFLAHMSGFSDYLFIKDPTKLYELKDEKQKNFCNWYVEVDSLKSKRFSDITTPPGVKYYSDTFTTRTLTTFPYHNELYSIYCTDSATILAKFQDLKLIVVDTLLHHRLYFDNANTHLADNTIVTAYEATWAIRREGSPWTHYQNTGLIFIRNNKITFLELQTPHMQTNSS
jgi:hypothetical protein